MKTIFHSDYWVEIPASEYQFGLSQEQRQKIYARVLEQVGYDQLQNHEQEIINSAVTKIRKRVELVTESRRQFLINGYTNQRLDSPIGLNDEEFNLITSEPLRLISDTEFALLYIPLPISIFVNTFYITKFPLTQYQYDEITKGVSLNDVAGALDSPPETREIAPIQNFSIIDAFDWRVPTKIEWEKAARGLDGRLYPWGNEWDLEIGCFYRGQSSTNSYRIDKFPRGISPYGIWGMAGGLPETVQARQNKPNVDLYYYTSKGCHDKESSEETAWFDHIVSLSGKGRWVSLRPVLDKWPVQQWRGYKASKDDEELYLEDK